MEWHKANNMLFPKEMNVIFSGPSLDFKIKMVYNKLTIGEPRELFIIIPENYEKCD
jgi:hypothetical protein